MHWIKAFHLIALVAWFSGLFYLPRLFVYHADSEDEISRTRFKLMEKRLYSFITLPAAIATSIFGFSLILFSQKIYLTQSWMQIKLILVALLWAYHFYLGHLLKQFQQEKNQHQAKFYRILNEVPTVFLILIVILAVVKP